MIRRMDDDVALVLVEVETADRSSWGVLTYRFDVRRAADGVRVGHLNLRVDPACERTRYVGHVGYGVGPAYRGRHYAERACRLVLPVAAGCGLADLWITCGPDNPASRRTLERLGANLVETVDVPADHELPPGAVRQKCRWRVGTARDHTLVEGLNCEGYLPGR